MNKTTKNQNAKKFKTAYDTPPLTGVKFTLPSRTQQQFKDENNPYSVIRKHTQGLPVKLNTKQPQYLDVSNVDPMTHSGKIEDLKKEIDEKIKNKQNAQKEQNDQKVRNTKNDDNQKKDVVPDQNNNPVFQKRNTDENNGN